MAKARGDAGLSDVREVAAGFGIFAWDGRVLETFGYGEASKRFHPAVIESIEFSEGRFLGPMVTITIPNEGQTGIAIGNDPATRAELESLLAEVENARGGVTQ